MNNCSKMSSRDGQDKFDPRGILIYISPHNTQIIGKCDKTPVPLSHVGATFGRPARSGEFILRIVRDYAKN